MHINDLISAPTHQEIMNHAARNAPLSVDSRRAANVALNAHPRAVANDAVMEAASKVAGKLLCRPVATGDASFPSVTRIGRHIEALHHDTDSGLSVYVLIGFDRRYSLPA